MNKKVTKFSPEVRERAVRLVREQRSEHPSMWATVESIAPMIGCTPQTLHEWVKRDQVDHGERDGVTTDERERLKALEREVKELRRANEILKVAARFSPRRSSTAVSSPEGLYRSASRHLRGRADLQGVADCPVGLLTPCHAAS
jgi:transposase